MNTNIYWFDMFNTNTSINGATTLSIAPLLNHSKQGNCYSRYEKVYCLLHILDFLACGGLEDWIDNWSLVVHVTFDWAERRANLWLRACELSRMVGKANFFLLSATWSCGVAQRFGAQATQSNVRHWRFYMSKFDFGKSRRYCCERWCGSHKIDPKPNERRRLTQNALLDVRGKDFDHQYIKRITLINRYRHFAQVALFWVLKPPTVSTLLQLFLRSPS